MATRKNATSVAKKSLPRADKKRQSGTIKKSATSSVKTLPKRSEVPVEETWDLSFVYTSEEQWEADFATLTARISEIAPYEGRLSESGAVLLEFLQLCDELSKVNSRLGLYAHLRFCEDQGDDHYNSLFKRMESLSTNLSTAKSFMAPEILSIPANKLESFVTETAGMEIYQQSLKELTRMRAHVRSAEVQKVLNQLGEVGSGPHSTFSVLNDTDLKFPVITDETGQKVQIVQENYKTLRLSKDRRVRRAAYRGYLGTYAKFAKTFAANYANQVNLEKFLAKIHLYGSAIESALDEDALPLSLYDALISTVHTNLPELQRYLRLRKRVLGLSELRPWDLYVPLVSEVEFKISCPEAQEMVLNAVAPLGDEYVSVLRNGFAARWVDYACNANKRSGAFSSGCYGTNPYILMSWQPTLEAVFTLAHEAGHSMHSYHTWANQPYPNANYGIFVAEVASTLNEMLLAHYLLQTQTDPALRQYIINRQLEAVRQTVYRQVLFAEFDRVTHAKAEAGEPLTSEVLCQIHHDLNEQYYAPATTLDDLIQFECYSVPHFYYNFYVFKYATGLSAAIKLCKQILAEGQPAVRRYLKFLSSGCSKTGLEVLKDAGVDLSSPEPVQMALTTFGEWLTEFESLF